MIIRSWRALAKKEMAAAYLAHFRREVLPRLRQLSGFRGATVLRREQNPGIEVIVLTRWESMQAVRAFAGQDCHTAVVADDAQPCFHSYEKTVTHHEIALDKPDAAAKKAQSRALTCPSSPAPPRCRH